MNTTNFEYSFNFILSLGQLIVSKVFVGNAAPVKSENKYVHWRSVISQSDYLGVTRYKFTQSAGKSARKSHKRLSHW